MPLAARAALWFAFAGIVQKSLSMLTMPIFTRLLTTEQYGLYSLYHAWLQVIIILTTLRLTYTVFSKGMSKYSHDRDAYTLTMQSVTTLVTLGTFVGYLIFRGLINPLTGLTTFITLAMFAELLATPAVNFWRARKRYDYLYRPIVLVTLGIALSNAGLGVLAVMASEDKGTARILSGVVVMVAFGGVLYIRNLLRGRRLFVPEYAKFALLFNLPLIPHYLSMYTLDQFDRIMVAQMVGLSAAALYSVAYNIGLVMKIATDSIANAFVPWLYRRLEHGNLETVEDRMFHILTFMALLAVAFVAVAPELITLLAGSQYVESMYIIPPVAVSMLFVLAYTMFADVQLFYEAKRFTMYASVIVAAVNVGLNYLLIGRFGYMAAAYTTLFCYFALAVAHYVHMNHVVRRETGRRALISARKFALLSTSLVVAAALLALTYETMIARYALILIAGTVLLVKREYVRLLFAKVKS